MVNKQSTLKYVKFILTVMIKNHENHLFLKVIHISRLQKYLKLYLHCEKS